MSPSLAARFRNAAAAITAALACASFPLARASDFVTVWQLGNDDASLSPFSQESFGPNSSPGSASAKDDDHYLAGTYPAPIGTVAADETITNFERAVTSGDPRNRVHFPLSAAHAGANSRLRLTIDLTGGGAWINGSIPGFATHDITVRFNGNIVSVRNGVAWDTTLVLSFPASTVSAAAGENIVQIERTGGAAGGYLGFDYLKLEADPVALADSDDDGMPGWFEDLYGFSDLDGADAGLDADDDGLSNLAEFQTGTNPRDRDSDNDGLTDSAELGLGSNPLSPDSDGDSIADGEEVLTNLLLADSDSDGYPDPFELEQGSAPNDAGSVPFDFPGAISLQFISEQHADARLAPWETAGYFRFPHWNSSAPLPQWVAGGTVLSGSQNNLTNHRGQSTGAGAAWTYHFAGDGLHKGPGNERLLDGMIRTERGPSVNTPATVNLSGIPYATYDIIVYPGYIYPTRRGVVRLDGNSATNRYFVSDSSPPFVGWREASASSLATVKAGNFVRYRNLTGTSHSITLESIDNEAVGIHGIQIIDSGSDFDNDGMTDITEIEHGFDPKTADANADADGDTLSNLAELGAGTSPHDADSDDDGISDGEESVHGSLPLVADTDQDGLTDGDEVHAMPFPSLANLSDSDGDGFSDPTERVYGTDPKSATSVPPSVPVWDAPTRTWRWRIDNLRILWNHDQSMLGAIQYDESMLCEAVADINQSGWSRQIGIGIRYMNGRLVHRFRGIEGAFHQNGNPGSGFWDSDWDAFPADRSRDLGLSGFGRSDESKPLRFEFTATQPVAGTNLWTLNFLIADLSNPSSPVPLASHVWNNAVAADSSLLNGSAVWKNLKGETGRIDLYAETGVRVLFSASPLAEADTDSDGMPDAWESTHSLQPNNPADADSDPDNDGLSNLREYICGTDPHDSDSDDDQANDGLEIRHGSDPNSNLHLPAFFAFQGATDDLDHDGLPDSWILWSGGKPRIPSADDDGDGLDNRTESIAGTDPDDPESRFNLISRREDDSFILNWTDLPDKNQILQQSDGMSSWNATVGIPLVIHLNGRSEVAITGVFPPVTPGRFYRVAVSSLDSDGDGVEDWVENQILGSSNTSGNSMGQNLPRPAGGDLSGDAIALLQRLQGSSATGGTVGSNLPGTPSPVQAARFLMQSSFGPTPESIQEVRGLGYGGWIDHQLTLPPSLLQPYIKRIKADAAGQHADKTYNYNTLDQFVYGNNVTTPFARCAVAGEDQLRQRMAFALSQILVVSRRDAQLEEKAEAMAHYYDTLVRNALGNYGDLLRDVTFHPAMGWYLSSAGNQKADPSIPRYPDENYAREIMQLFTIGLWKLHPDGTRLLDIHGEPVPTYDNGDITELARVFTGMYFASPYGWGGGGWADEHYTLPMVMYADRHDFGSKQLPDGFVIPSREISEENGMQDIKDAVDALFRHPNTPPFVCKQLIQFLVTDNPSPSYVKRVQDVFVDDGNGTRGNLGAVAKAILLDPEARQIPLSGGSGKVREPVIRTMHLGRIMRLAETHPDFVWWNWTENFYNSALQEPMNAPSVFNFYTPVYQAPGEIRVAGLVSPGFQIVNTYSAVSFPNLLWDYLHDGFKSGWTWEFPLDYGRSLILSEDPAALVDQIDLLVCAGNLSARTRGILMTALTNPDLSQKERVALALWTAMNSPEGVIQR
jgi:uncharacterized protein (DUF1800 family)